MGYRARAVDGLLRDLLAAMGGVLIEGPRGCGKSTTAGLQAGSTIRLDANPSTIQLADLDPQALLRGETPRLIDEWQLAPSLWNVMRHDIDSRNAPGQFIMTGSASPQKDPLRHSGAGRIGRITMRTMTLSEMGYSSDLFTLDDLSTSRTISGASVLSYREIAERAVTGGWPALLGVSHQQASTFNRSYLDNITAIDVPSATGVRHAKVRMRRLLESVARNTATEVSIDRLAEDVSADGGHVDRKTIRTYLDALSTVFVLDELPAWSVALRSRSRLRSRPKINLVDPALACAALGLNATRLAQDPEFFGQVFESMVTRDVRVALDAQAGRTFHYRDNTGLEIDLILEFDDGTWAAVEVKLGQARIAEADRNLTLLRDSRVDRNKVGDPRFLAVITAGEFAYTLPSGVHVLPLATFASHR